MKNLEQIRARNVLRFKAQTPALAGKNGGELVKKIPPLILNHGLLATLAYSFSKDNDFKKLFDAVASHLACEEIALIPREVNDRELLIDHLTEEADSQLLKLVTAETMAWLNYARRFIQKEGAEK